MTRQTVSNRQKKTLRRFDNAMIAGLFLAFLFTNLCAFGLQCETVREDVVRLHIVAHSDSQTDQQVKLLIRDAILVKLGALFETPQSQADAKKLAQQRLPQIEKIARSVLKENGMDLQVSASLCHMYFNTRHYDNFSLPAGNYDAVRVTIGDGAGHNWWCVMYPPLCLPAARQETPDTEENNGADGAKQAEVEIDELNRQSYFQPKLAVVELFESLFHID